jgi:hypothetical protein
VIFLGHQRQDLTGGGNASPGVAGDEVQVAPRVRVGHAAAEQFDRKQDGSQGVVQFVSDFVHAETQDVERRRGGKGQ